MRVLLVHPNSVSGGYLIPALTSLSAVLKKAGHNVELFDTTFLDSSTVDDIQMKEKNLEFKKVNLSNYGIGKKKVNVREEFENKIREFKPDLIAASVVSSEFDFLMSFVDIKDKFNIPILLGGIHPTVAPEETIKEKCVDIICIGEGEEAIVELAEKIEKEEDITKIKNLWVKHEGKIVKNQIGGLIPDLDKLPFPDWSIFDKRHLIKPFWGKVYRFGYFEMGRGCPYSCSFCVNSFLHTLYGGKGKFHREKSVERIIEEMKHYKEKYNFNFVQFTDETMLVMSKEKLQKFVEMYKKHIGLPFYMLTRPEVINEEKIKLIGSMNLCKLVGIGLETGNDKIRHDVCKKYFTNKQVIESARILHKYNLRIATYNMIGLPYETRKDIFDTIRVNKKIKSKPCIVYFFYPFKGTPLRDLCEKEGYLDEKDTKSRPTVDTMLRMPQISHEELKAIRKVFPIYLRTPEFLWGIVKICESDSFLGKMMYSILINFFEFKFNYLEDWFV
ncbi:MAG: radical SAM protein [Nanoarchaeota archaeon]|nr:radical SAM protein [Nanoarchaeota archaeon]